MVKTEATRNWRDGAWEVVGTLCSQLGESPVWDHVRQRVIWVDILGRQVHFFSPAAGEERSIRAGQLVGTVALRTNGGLVAALENGIYFLDEEEGPARWIAQPSVHEGNTRFNDGKCDPAGRFWVGTMSMNGVPEAASLYMLDADLSLSVKIAPVSVSNGLAWSPDQRLFYFIDTPTRQVVAYDFEPTAGAITNKRTVIRIPAEMGRPDGMTIDDEGMLWIALWDGGCVSRWDPYTGTLLFKISLPATRITSCTFGGPHLQDLYVTSASTGLTGREREEQPLAGRLFVIPDTGCRGLPTVAFKG